MIKTSETYKRLFDSGEVQEYLVFIGSSEIKDDVLYTLTLSENLFESDSFSIGSCCSSELSFSMKNIGTTIVLGSPIRFLYRYVTLDTQSEWIERFIGNVTYVEKENNGRLNIRATDILSTMEVYGKFLKSAISYPISARRLAKTIAERLGTTIYDELSVSDVTLYTEPSDDNSLVSILKEIAIVSCGNWAVSQGKLKMVVQDDRKESVGRYALVGIDDLGAMPYIKGVILYKTTDNLFASGDVSDEKSVFTIQTMNASQESCDYLFEKLDMFDYNAYRATKVFIDASVELGDYIDISGANNERVLCASMDFVFDGSCSCNIESPFSELSDNLFSEIEKDIQSEINASLPFLVYDYNKQQVTSDNDNEKYVAMIPISVSKSNVDMDAGFRTGIKVDNDGILTERFYRDGVEELFSPVVMDIKKGRHLLSDDHAYLNVSSGKHTYVASLQFDGGNMEIEPRKTLYTIEASRVGERDFSIEGKVIDMTLSGNKISGVESLAPDEVWFLVQDLESGLLEVKYIKYSESATKSNIVDGITYSEEIISGAIEFGGYWEESKFFKGKKVFVSNSIPYVALVDFQKSLKVYLYNDEENALHTVEESNVLDVSMVQGWDFKDIFLESSNMGMVIAYIMEDGKMYYKTISDGTIDFQRYEIVFEGAIYPLKEVRTFRTNDYRVGFEVVDSEDSLFTALTDRYYQGDSVESTHLKADFSENSTEMHFGEYIIPQAINGRNIDNENVVIEFNYKANGTESNITGLYLVDSKPTPQSYYPIGNKISHEETSEFVDIQVDNPISNIFSLFQGWGVYEPVKGIGDAIAPIYAVTSTSNLTFDHAFGGLKPLTWGISNQKVLLPDLLPVDVMEKPIPLEQSRVDIVVSVLSNENASIIDFREIKSYTEYYSERLQSSFNENNVTMTPLVEMEISRIYGSDRDSLSSTFGNEQATITDWEVISTDPV